MNKSMIAIAAAVALSLSACGSGAPSRPSVRPAVVPVVGTEVAVDRVIRYDVAEVAQGASLLVFPILHRPGTGYIYPHWDEMRSRKGFMDSVYEEKARAHPLQEVGMDKFYIVAPDIDEKTELVLFLCPNSTDKSPSNTMLRDVQDTLRDWTMVRYTRRDMATVVRHPVEPATVDVTAMVRTAWALYRRYAEAHGQ